MEAADAGIELIVCNHRGIPVIDMVKVWSFSQGEELTPHRPELPGVISPGKCKIGIMPGHIHLEGNVGVVSRSGTLTYEAVGQLTKLGIGQSTASASAEIRSSAPHSSTPSNFLTAIPIRTPSS